MATLTLEHCTPEFITSLRNYGMDSVRINSAHVTPDELCAMVKTIRRTDPAIKILMDTKGAEIRTTDVTSPLTLNAGDTTIICHGESLSTPDRIYVNCRCIESCPGYGTKVLIDDGDIELKIIRVDSEGIQCRVVEGGIVDSRKTVAFPGTLLPHLPAVSETDRRCIEAAKKANIDMIAHSFVRSAQDIHDVRDIIGDTDITLYAKIECEEAVEHLEDILTAADGLLVARGDLGTAMPIYEIPAIQHRVVSLCRQSGKPVIVSTQILQSMFESPVPTRAEVSDIALAVMEGTDTLLLCGETAVGLYPARCVEVMRKTIDSTIAAGLQCVIV